MAHPQNSSRGAFAKSSVSIAGSALTYDDITFNSTAALLAVGLRLSNNSTSTLTANSTGFISSGAMTVSGQATGGKLTANTTGLLVNGAVYVSAKTTGGKLTANTTAVTFAGGIVAVGTVAVSNQATAGLLSANSTALILPNSVRVGTKTTYFSSNSTGVKLGSRYISTNTTGNSTT
jgi:hypothetical protein